MGQVVKPLYTPRYVPSGDEVAVIETSKGTIRVALDGKSAPLTVGNFIELACNGFYDDLNFYNRQEGKRIPTTITWRARCPSPTR